jgi:hypothetical protein
MHTHRVPVSPVPLPLPPAPPARRFHFPPSGYINPVQMLTLTSYVLFGFIATECILAAYISRIHPYRRRMAAIVAMASPGDVNEGSSGATSRTTLFTKWVSAKGTASAASTRPSGDGSAFELSEGPPVVGPGMTRDEAHALLLAAKVDRWTAIVLLVSYLLVFIIILIVGSAVGDHKLMLGGSMVSFQPRWLSGRPARMLHVAWPVHERGATMRAAVLRAATLTTSLPPPLCLQPGNM